MSSVIPGQNTMLMFVLASATLLDELNVVSPKWQVKENMA